MTLDAAGLHMLERIATALERLAQATEENVDINRNSASRAANMLGDFSRVAETLAPKDEE